MGKRTIAIKNFLTFYRAEFFHGTRSDWGRAMALGTTLTSLVAFSYFLFKKYITETWRWQEAAVMNL